MVRVRSRDMVRDRDNLGLKFDEFKKNRMRRRQRGRYWAWLCTLRLQSRRNPANWNSVSWKGECRKWTLCITVVLKDAWARTEAHGRELRHMDAHWLYGVCMAWLTEWMSDSFCCSIVICFCAYVYDEIVVCRWYCDNKKALLSQRRPRDAPNIWVPWKVSRVLANAPGYFSRNL